MTQQEFNLLLKRYLEGQTTEQEDQFLLEWYQSPANQQELDLPEMQKQVIQKRIWNTIKQQQPFGNRRIWVRWSATVAAAACLLVGALWWSAPFLSDPEILSVRAHKKTTGIELKNTTATDLEVALPDGTTVLLSQNSSLVYDKDFNRIRREVYLQGSAFFSVKRDETRPFVVHAGALVTEVLGTSFRIRNNPEENTTEVSVRTGKVSVYAEKKSQQGDRNGVIITPNQRVIFETKTQNIIPSIVESPEPLLQPSPQPIALTFQEATLPAVLARLTALYGIEFVISNPNANLCQITADLQGLSMFTQLDLICKSIDATYEKRGTVVFINGDGCN